MNIWRSGKSGMRDADLRHGAFPRIKGQVDIVIIR